VVAAAANFRMRGGVPLSFEAGEVLPPFQSVEIEILVSMTLA